MHILWVLHGNGEHLEVNKKLKVWEYAKYLTLRSPLTIVKVCDKIKETTVVATIIEKVLLLVYSTSPFRKLNISAVASLTVNFNFQTHCTCETIE